VYHFLLKGTHTLLNIASEATNHGNGIFPFGILVVGIIQAPVLILLLATFLGKPRQPKITGVFIGFIAMMVIMFIGAVFGLSYLLGIFY
jgi:hypothetical protein